MYYPPRIEDPPPGFGLRQRTWRREALLLNRISNGQSIAVMVREDVAKLEEIHPGSGSLKGSMRRLQELDLIWSETRGMYLGGGGRAGVKMDIVGLTDLGRELCQELNWDIRPTEYETLCRLHEGERFPEHTLAILVFARQARLRGHTYDICPQNMAEGFTPDIALYDTLFPDEDMYNIFFVEVERKGHTPGKWRRAAEVNLRNQVYVCAPNPAKRTSLVREISGLGYGGQATDLRTLLYKKDCPLWLEDFQPQ